MTSLRPTQYGAVRVGDDGRNRDSTVLTDVVGHLVKVGERRSRHRLDEDVDDAAAGQADREGIAVADPIAVQPWRPGLRHLGGQFINSALDAATRHRPTH